MGHYQQNVIQDLGTVALSMLQYANGLSVFRDHDDAALAVALHTASWFMMPMSHTTKTHAMSILVVVTVAFSLNGKGQLERDFRELD